jgi:uncharacterized membrane protein
MNFVGALTVLFIGLKLGGIIAWSWFWVISPILIPFVLIVILIFLGVAPKPNVRW